MGALKINSTFYAPDRNTWREWLAEHYDSATEIWLIYYRKHTGKPRIPYNDAVEEALCFGWIDSTAKSLDEERFAQRFTPRKRGSTFSQPNKERLGRMRDRNKLLPEVLEHVKPVLDEPFRVAEDIAQAISSNQRVRDHFQRYSEAYRRIRIAYIESARDRPEEFEKRLAHFIKMTERDRQFGHGIETYF